MSTITQESDANGSPNSVIAENIQNYGTRPLAIPSPLPSDEIFPTRCSHIEPLNLCHRSSLQTICVQFPLSSGERAGVRAISPQPRHEALTNRVIEKESLPVGD